MVRMAGDAEAGRRCERQFIAFHGSPCLACSTAVILSSPHVPHLRTPYRAVTSSLAGCDFPIHSRGCKVYLIFGITHFSPVQLPFLDLYNTFLCPLRKFITYITQWPISLFNTNGFHILSATTAFVQLLSLPEAVQEDLDCKALCDLENGYRLVFLTFWNSYAEPLYNTCRTGFLFHIQ